MQQEKENDETVEFNQQDFKVPKHLETDGGAHMETLRPHGDHQIDDLVVQLDASIQEVASMRAKEKLDGSAEYSARGGDYDSTINVKQRSTAVDRYSQNEQNENRGGPVRMVNQGPKFLNSKQKKGQNNRRSSHSPAANSSR